MKDNSKIELTSFVDYTKKVAIRTRPFLLSVLDHFGDRIEMKTKFYSTSPSNSEFVISSKAALAAELQGRMDDLHELLIHYKETFTEDAVFTLAESIDLDMERFREDFESEYVSVRLEEDKSHAKERDVNFAPSLTINGYMYKDAWDEEALMEAINGAKAKPVEQAVVGFIHWGASAAIALLVAAIAALVFVNLGFLEDYEFLRHFKLGLNAGDADFILPLEVWINDGLMAVFFLLIGLEIKREIISGELSEMKKAAMPIVGAIGGMVVPVLLYLAINWNGEEAYGWGVPMATDIAFTLGLMALLGSRVPGSLKVFISALAVSDDLGAIIVIALFYGHGFHLDSFIVSLVIIAIMGLLNYFKVYSKTSYILLGILLWFFIYKSGLHATLAGVLTAVLIPARRRGNIVGIATQARVIFDHEIERIQDANNTQENIRHGALRVIDKAINRLTGPGEKLEHFLENPVNYFILPLFAFFNTGILVVGTYFDVFTPINLGIIVGLCIGKPLGIMSFCWIASKVKWASLSPEFNWSQLLGAACLAGVGFTMSIVVAGSAFEGETLDGAKLSILIASFISAIAGLFILNRSLKPN
ncbi:MAG: NhaA family Na+:H+ antiporter [Cryomorphaceae bacterium]|jgi:NhaA family Na+:H+ antiporter